MVRRLPALLDTCRLLPATTAAPDICKLLPATTAAPADKDYFLCLVTNFFQFIYSQEKWKHRIQMLMPAYIT